MDMKKALSEKGQDRRHIEPLDSRHNIRHRHLPSCWTVLVCRNLPPVIIMQDGQARDRWLKKAPISTTA